MKISIFIFFLALCADSWAQLTCTNCSIVVNGAAVGGTPGNSLIILDSPGTFEGTITVTGDCVFTVTGAGNYTLAGQITGAGTVTYHAPDAGGDGNQAGITLSGPSNDYSGLTTITGGYLICNKMNAVSVPHGLKISAVDGHKSAHLWCLADNQFGTSTAGAATVAATVVDFSDTQWHALFHLNGTTQTIAGLAANSAASGKGGVENTEGLYYLPIGKTAGNFFSDQAAVLKIAGGSPPSVFVGGSYIRNGVTNSPALTVNVISGTQVIQDPSEHIKYVTFTSDPGATLELRGNGKFGEHVTFRGDGNIIKTGPGTVQTNNSTLLKATGQIRVSGGILRNENPGNVYVIGNESNLAALQVDADAVFDLWGNASIFDGLTGRGVVRNNWGDNRIPSEGGYKWLTLGQNNSQGEPAFEGVIRNNSSSNDQVGTSEAGGGIALKKVGTGTQILKGANRYTGTTEVSSGTLKLQDGGQLGNNGTYGGGLEIANVAAAASQAVFEHNGSKTQVFNGTITNTGEGTVKGIFLQSGTGKSLINGVNTFTGQVNVTGGFLGGSGSLKHAAGVAVGAGSIGGGNGLDAGGTLVVTGLSLTAASKLTVTSVSGAPGLVEVKERGTDNPGTITVSGAFTVDLPDAKLVSGGHLIKCTITAPNPPLPVVGMNSTGRSVTFRWEADGLHMDLAAAAASGLSCSNCTFTSGTETKTGTSASPAFILTSPGDFAGAITLTGDCNFTITGTGNYTLSGPITGNYSLTLNAPGDNNGGTAGLTFEGVQANRYGSTRINSGYIICNKTGAVSIPGSVKLVAGSANSYLWCLADNQFSENAVVDFTGTVSYGCFALNGTFQTIAGLTADTNRAVVENNGDFRPGGIDDERVSTLAATLTIKAGTGTYTFGGGGQIRKGGGNSSAFTVYVISGTQIIQNPTENINNVTLTTATGAALEFNTTNSNSNSDTYTLGGGITFRGAGLIKKTGPGNIATNRATYLITGTGKFWVHEGIWRNHNANNSYSSGTESNKAMLQVDGPGAVFDLMSDASGFGGLTGGGWVRNNWGRDSGFTDFTLNQNDTETPATFSGVIQNNQSNGTTVNGEGDGKGGIRLKKEGNGMQILTGVNTYSGATTVSAGRLKLAEGAKLGEGSFRGELEIANVAEAASQAVFEHNGTQTQIFQSSITSFGTGNTKGMFLQSGSGKSIINGSGGTTPFNGSVSITGGFLGGSGSLKNATAVYVETGGSIGGGTGVAAGGGTLTVPALRFATGSKLIVSSTQESDKRPSAVKVETAAGEPGNVTVTTGATGATGGFTVDIMGIGLVSGYILKCANGTSLPLPVLGQHGFSPGGAQPSFRWDAQGLYMEIPSGLTCNNCTFVSGTETKTGTPENPVRILDSPGTFTGDVTLTGDCKFVITGMGNYTFSGQIKGPGSLTYIADTREQTFENGPYEYGYCGEGNSAGVTFIGNRPNTYTGLTTIQSGYLICTKSSGVAAVPHDLKICSRADGPPAHIWFYSNHDMDLYHVTGYNQLGGGSTIVDFTNTGNNAYFHLNATTQTIAGLKANNNKATVHNRFSKSYHPSTWTYANISQQTLNNHPSGILNINVAENSTHTFGGGSSIDHGNVFSGFPPPGFIMNITGGTQIIENPAVSQVKLETAGSAILELKSTGAVYKVGDVSLKENGIIKKTGLGMISMANTSILKSGGKIWVSGGILRNEGSTVYTQGDQSNKAVLEVDAPSGINNPTFDLYGIHSIFGGLAGGGWVQNNRASSSDGGYNFLTLNRDNTATSTFTGVIRDNSLNTGVAGDLGKGGIALKKEGTGTQVLAGANLYTGSTTVSAGTLKLQGDGRLGIMNAGTYTGTYAGVLEIANAAAAASQVTFEHNGSQAQTFTGNITNTGEGTTKAIFLQSGTGRSIINGTKSFTGHVNVTNGFLGGSGDLSHVTAVTVEAGGSIGGGDREAANGNTLTVSNLTFAAATSKLVVTSTTEDDHRPSLVIVSGTLTAATGFRVEVVGTMASGYILRCTNGAAIPVSLVDLSGSDMAGKVRLMWDTHGLWMQVRSGNFTLKPATSVCAKGTNPGNPSITVEAEYENALDLPSPSASPNDYFTLSNNEVKTGSIRVTREGNKIKAEFDGANTTDTDLPYRITFDDHKNPVVTSGVQKINRRAAVSTASGLTTACLGAPLALQAAGTGAVTVTALATDPTKITVTPNTTTALSFTATAAVAGNVNFLAVDGDGCKSEYLPVEVKVLPVITPATPAVCVNGSLILTADRDPAAITANTYSAWVTVPANTNWLEDVTPGDRAVNFKAPSTAQDVTVEYTDVFGCKATTTVKVSAGLALTYTSTSPICSKTETDILLTPSLSSPEYEWTVNANNNVGAQSRAKAPLPSNRIVQKLTNDGNAPVRVTYSVKGTSGACVSPVVDIVVEVTNSEMAARVSGDGEYCVNPETGRFRTNIIPSVEGGATGVTWTYTSYFPEGQAAGLISHNSQQVQAGALQAVNDDLLLSGTAPASVYYVFRPSKDCLGPAATVQVKLHPGPVATATSGSTSVCSLSDPSFPKAQISLTGDTPNMVYTWTVDKTNSPDVTGYTEPSRNGASVPGSNPGEAKASPIQETLLLPDAAVKAQAIRYNITPWHSGCPGKVVLTDVLVYPRPVITGLSPSTSVCNGGHTAVNLVTNFSEPEKYRVTYSWTVQSSNLSGIGTGLADQSTFVQQNLSLNENATEGNVTYSFTPLYTPVAGNSLSCVGRPAVASYTVFKSPVAGSLDKTAVEACLGDAITLNATPQGVNFQWLKNNNPISGATGSSYTIPTTVPSDEEYKVRNTNACGNVDSEGKKVKVTADAYFTAGKAVAAAAKTEAIVSQPVTFTYTGPPAVYSWDFDDQTTPSTEQNPSHSYQKAATYNPKLKAVKQGQEACLKTFQLPELKVKEAPSSGDPGSWAALRVFPIPAHDRLTVVNEGDLQHITLNDLNGKTVIGETVHGREAVLSIGHLAAGIYILTVVDSKGVQRLKISKKN